MLADRVRMSYIKKGIPDYYVLATDDDFYDFGDGQIVYTGYDSHIIIPHVIKGVPVTSYASMFAATNVIGVASDNPNVTNMSNMFADSQATTLDLSHLDTSNVTDMSGMFYGSVATTFDLSSFDTSNVTNMSDMFASSRVTTLDLSSFDTSNVTNMDSMFENSWATTGYARTQADANKFNASSGKPSTLVFVVK